MSVSEVSVSTHSVDEKSRQQTGHQSFYNMPMCFAMKNILAKHHLTTVIVCSPGSSGASVV